MARLQLGVDVTVEGARELQKVSDSLGGTSDELRQLGDSLDNAADAARRAASDVDAARGSLNFDSASQSANNLEDAGEGVRNAINGVTDVMKAAGDESLAFHERAALAAGGIADMASGARNALIPALQGIKNGALQSGAAMVSSVGKQVAAWTVLGVQSLLHAAKVAAAWLLAMGPVALIVAAVIAVVALIILNWEKVRDFIIAIWNKILDFFKGVGKAIADFGKALWTPISDGFAAAIDFIKGIWNTFVRFWNGIQIEVPSVDLPIIGKVGGFTIGLPDLPMLAAGGIVNSPTLAMIGEKGREAVVPLPANGLGETNITVNIGSVQGNERRIPGQILRGLYVAGLD